jgi:hypothetical protein
MVAMDLQRERLAELIVHLTDCSVSTAFGAVDAALEHHAPPEDTEESLEILARAIVLVRRPALDLRERLDLVERDAQEANVGGRRSDHGAADSS